MAPTSLPSTADLPAALRPILYPDVPALSAISNVVLFLPGLGDSSENFSSFAQALNLPDTLAITFQAPHPLSYPVGPGFYWSDDLQVNISEGGSIDDTESIFSRALDLVGDQVINKVLIGRCGFKPAQVHLFGYGQGGSLALCISLHCSVSSMDLGGVISLAGPLPPSAPLASTNSPRCRTPVLVAGGSNGVIFRKTGESKLNQIQACFETVEAVRWRTPNDSMPANREEILPLMAFWGRRLRSKRGIPRGAVEIS